MKTRSGAGEAKHYRVNTGPQKNPLLQMEVGEETSFLKFGAMGKGKSLSTPLHTPAPLSSIPDVMKEYVSVTPQAKEFWLQYPEGEAAAAEDGEPLSTLPGRSCVGFVMRVVNCVLVEMVLHLC